MSKKSIPIRILTYIIKRDKNTCQYCGKVGTFIFRWGKPCVAENPDNIVLENNKNYNDRNLIPFHLDHIIPRVSGGTNSIDNLVLSCRKCNLSKGKKEIKKWTEENKI